MNESSFSKIKRRYFEAFGDLEEEIHFLRKLALFLFGIVGTIIFFFFLIAKKPPVVIRVSEVGIAEVIRDLNRNNAPDQHEIIGFAKRFTVRYTAYNSYTVSRDIAEAFNAMTRRFQKEAQKQIIDSGFLTKIAQTGMDTQIEFKEEKLERDSRDVAIVSLVGVRRITRYGSEEFSQDVLFRADLVLKKVSRTQDSPDGLLVDEYREMILNDFTERK